MILVVGQDERRPGQGAELVLGDLQVLEPDPQADLFQERRDSVGRALGSGRVIEAVERAVENPAGGGEFRRRGVPAVAHDGRIDAGQRLAVGHMGVDPAHGHADPVEKGDARVGDAEPAQDIGPGHPGPRFKAGAVVHGGREPGRDDAHGFEGHHVGVGGAAGIDVTLEGVGQDVEARRSGDALGDGEHELGVDDADLRVEPGVEESRLGLLRSVRDHGHLGDLRPRARRRGHGHNGQRPFRRLGGTEKEIIPAGSLVGRFHGDGLGRVHARAPAHAQDDVGPELAGHPRPGRDHVGRGVGRDSREMGVGDSRGVEGFLDLALVRRHPRENGLGDEQAPPSEARGRGACFGDPARAEADFGGLEVLEWVHEGLL